MDLLSSARIIWRHKWLVAGLMVLTLLLAFVIGGAIKPTYKAGGQLVLLPPAALGQASDTGSGQGVTTTTEQVYNPLLSAQGLGVLANAAVVVVNDKQSVDRIIAAGGLDTFTLAADEQGGGSFITLEVTGSDSDKVLSTYNQ